MQNGELVSIIERARNRLPLFNLNKEAVETLLNIGKYA